jgi:crotonobetainyl-CoA:carnitine CoA-transferase CaiB-like acyl-CoA transferase
LSRLYAAADGWLYIHAPDDHSWRKLVSLPQFSGLGSDARFADEKLRKMNDHALASEIAVLTAGRERSRLMQDLKRAGIDAAER